MDTTLYQFKIGCATGGADCAPVSTRADVSSWSPAVANNYVYAISNGGGFPYLAALKASCVGCGPAWTARLPNSTDRAVAVGDNKVFVADGTSLLAFSAACGATTCSPLWTTPVTSYPFPPTIAGDLVYVLSANDLVAFPTDCYNGCPGRWHAGSGALYINVLYAAVTVADGVVYSPDETGLTIYALRPPAAAPVRVNVSQLKPAPQFAVAEQKLAAQLAAATH